MQPINLAICHVYVINLEHRVDRYEECRVELQKSLGLDIDDPTEVTVVRPRKFDNAAGFPNAGYRSCLDAHLICVEDAKAKGYSNALILEDDIAFEAGWLTEVEAALEELDDLNWSFATLGYLKLVAPGDELISTNHWQLFNGRARGSHAYLINDRSYDDLIEHYQKVAVGTPGDKIFGPMGPDGALNTLIWDKPHLERYLLKSNPAGQRSSASDCNPRSGMVGVLLHKLKINLLSKSKLRAK